jgi:midasin (ATPase involved in ribosome maturation)
VILDSFERISEEDRTVLFTSLFMTASFVRLCEDRTYEEEPTSIDAILKPMAQPPGHLFPDIPAEAAGEFIFTDGAKERMAKIYSYFQNKIPILLEGPTGTSKTRSVQMICTLLGSELVRLNLSAETVTEDIIMGRLVSDPNTWGGFTFKLGPFIRAF